MVYHKHRAIATERDGFKFPSRLEANTYSLLARIHDAGAIANLILQHEFKLHGANGSQVCIYQADFVLELTSGERFVVESKGKMMPVAALKLKLFRAEHSLPLLIIKSETLEDLLLIATDVELCDRQYREQLFKEWFEAVVKPKSKPRKLESAGKKRNEF